MGVKIKTALLSLC